MSNLHRYVIGIPELPVAIELDKCPVCIQAKLTKAVRGKVNSRMATKCFQGLSIDMGLIACKSKNTDCFDHLVGLNGETCKCLIVDHFGRTLFGQTFRSKAPPVEYVTHWLARHGLGPPFLTNMSVWILVENLVILPKFKRHSAMPVMTFKPPR